MIPRDLMYQFPQAGYLLVFFFVIAYLWVSLSHFRQRALATWAQGVVKASLGAMRSNWIYAICGFCLASAWILVVLALMQPAGNARYPQEQPPGAGEEAPLKRKSHDVVFLLDASASMTVKDTRTGTSRLEVAKELADEIASRMEGQALALYAFTTKATKIVPATLDYLFLRLMIRQVQINEGDIPGTDLEAALKDWKEATPSTVPALRTLILLSDGGDTQLESETGAQRQQRIQTILAQLGDPVKEHLRVFTIGIGSSKGATIPNMIYEGKPVVSSLQADVLEALSKAGRGNFYLASEYSALDIADDIHAWMGKDNPYYRDVSAFGQPSEEDRIYDLFYQIPLGIGILLLGVALLLPRSIQKIFLCIALAMPSLTFGLGTIDPVQRSIQTSIEIGHYDAALETIESLLATPELPNWKRNILFYNQGTIYLMVNDPKKSLSSFLQVNKPNSILNARLQWNTAVAKYKLATAYDADLFSNPDMAFHDYIKAFIFLREARYQAKDAQKSYCDMQLETGVSPCVPSEFLNNLDQASENALMRVSIEAGNYLVSRAPLVEVIPALQRGLRDAFFELNFLMTRPMDPALKERYQTLFIEEQNSWKSLWDSATLRIGESERTAFKAAHDEYTKITALLRKGRVEDSKEAALSCEQQLHALYASLVKASPSEALLRELLFNYRMVVSIFPLQEIEIQRLSQEQAQVFALLPPNPLMEDAKMLVKRATQALGAEQQVKARLFLLAATFQIRRLTHHYRENTPKEQLDLVMDAQELAFQVNQIALEHSLSIDESIFDLMKGTQLTVDNLLEDFWALAAKAQKDGFAKDCQAQPWGTVLPIVERGRRWALQAFSMMDESNPKLKTILTRQDQALQQFREALGKWDEAAKIKGCGGADYEPKPKEPPKESKAEEKNEEQEQQQQQPKPSTSNLLRLLQELEQDDRRPPEHKAMGPAQGSKPW